MGVIHPTTEDDSLSMRQRNRKLSGLERFYDAVDSALQRQCSKEN